VGSGSALFSGNMILGDNATTSLAVDFSDAILLAGTNADDLFRLIELAERSRAAHQHSRRARGVSGKHQSGWRMVPSAKIHSIGSARSLGVRPRLQFTEDRWLFSKEFAQALGERIKAERFLQKTLAAIARFLEQGSVFSVAGHV
jgi:hypothetical protein